MLSRPEFEKKQLVFAFLNDGDKLSFKNDNLIVRSAGGEIRHQSTCYRVLAVFAVGNASITTGLIERAHRFGFPIFLMKENLRVYDVLGHVTEGTTKLRRRQYLSVGVGIAQRLVANKIGNQRAALMRQRNKTQETKEAIQVLAALEETALCMEGNVHELMGLEGSAAKAYFPQQFNNADWTSRKPRVKGDFLNAVLDFGYTILFHYMEALLKLFGFDLYVGVLHREFYMRKSLVCDFVEPFRPLIDLAVRKAVSLGQCRQEDFSVRNGRWELNKEERKRYVGFLVRPILENRTAMFCYVQDYYRAFIREADAAEYPWFGMEGA